MIVPRRILWDSLKEITGQTASECQDLSSFTSFLQFFSFLFPPVSGSGPSLGLFAVKQKHYSAMERENYLLANTSPCTVISDYFS